MTYRPEIDGLRCVAVMAVLAYHFGLLEAEGGFVGVDVFFVISGYLITGIVWSEVRAQRFSLIKFYERRVRRIFPALAAVLIVTTAVAALVQMPLDFKDYGESLFAVTIFASNFFFYLRTGYFNGEAEIRPLLHTWSLAVEEQFYFFLPLLLHALNSRRQWAVPLLAIIGVLSFALCAVMMDGNTQAAFFMLWARAWEFLFGSLLAVSRIRPGGRLVQELAGWMGIVLIAGAVFGYTAETPFPGWAAILPTVGATAILYAGGKSSVGRILSMRVMVFLGTISYSMYLWHWPLVSFFRYLGGREPNTLEGLAMVTVSIGLAYVSWRWVEQPFRHAKPAADGRLSPVLAYACGFILVGTLLGFTLRYAKGLPQRFPAEVAQAGIVAFDINPLRKQCDSRAPEQIRAGDVCEVGASAAEPSFLVIGDSFGDALVPGIAFAAEEAGRRGYVVTRGGCLPLADVDQSVADCTESVKAALDLARRNTSLEAVILIGRWTTAVEGRRFGVNQNAAMFITDGESAKRSYAENRAVTERGLRRTLKQLKGKRVFVVAYVPEQQTNVPRQAALGAYLGIGRYEGVSREAFSERQAGSRHILEKLQREFGFTILDASAHLCDEAYCYGQRNGVPLYVDDNHVSRSTARSMRGLFHAAVGSP